MSNQLWKAKWQRNDIAFHQHAINPLLQQYLPNLGLSAEDCLLVPLCGKSVDMGWLSKNGFHVIGVELSEIAIQACFDAQNVTPTCRQHGHFTCWQHDNIEIWCGDIFDLGRIDLCNVKVLYDNAALTALPADSRAQYVRHFSQNLPHDCRILLITDETPDELQHNSVQTIDSEVTRLYANDYRIDLLHGGNSIKKDPEYPEEPACPMEEKVYLITRQDQH